MKKRITICWLIPAAPYRELFREYIRILAREFDGPRFEPHLTLCPLPDGKTARAILRQVKAKPVRLGINEIAFSARYTKTLYVRFHPTKSLEKLVGRLGGKPKSLRDPHVSLLYKGLPATKKRELAATIKLPFREVVFDQIKAVRCPSPTATAADVKAWRVLATKRLSG